MLLDFKETEELLEKHDLPLSQSKSVDSVGEALKFARSNYPVVLKVFSTEVLHRTEEDLVKVGIENEEDLRSGFKKLSKKTEEIKDAQIIIQKQEEGIELICGMKRDETFGPVLMFGLGGVFVEALKDVSFGIVPLDREEALEMMKSIRGAEVLKGFRGYPEVDLNNLADFLVKVSGLSEREEVEEIDFNPVFVKGREIKIADPKIIL